MTILVVCRATLSSAELEESRHHRRAARPVRSLPLSRARPGRRGAPADHRLAQPSAGDRPLRVRRGARLVAPVPRAGRGRRHRRRGDHAGPAPGRPELPGRARPSRHQRAASQAIARARAEARGLVESALRGRARCSISTGWGSARSTTSIAAACCTIWRTRRPEWRRSPPRWRPMAGSARWSMRPTAGRASTRCRRRSACSPATRRRRERLAVGARRRCRWCPTTNWLARNPFVGDHRGQGDAGLYDLLLNPVDRPFTVRERGGNGRRAPGCASPG